MDVVKSGPQWANGCDKCSYGIQIEPAQFEAWGVPLYMKRSAGAHLQETIFCDCKAGTRARAHALTMWSKYGNDNYKRQAEALLSHPANQ